MSVLRRYRKREVEYSKERDYEANVYAAAEAD